MAFAPNSHRPPLGFPARRGEVYQRVLEGLLGEWEAVDKGIAPDRDLIQAQLRLLEELAYRFFPNEELSNAKIHDFLWDPRSGYVTELDSSHPLKRSMEQSCKRGLVA